ncbi:hypothetical protein HFO56_33220 [Rhizobium laguerreae]|uniref:hypothetical protein n=1 Tax=Rhizobium laguerreae TaxID=1076926 RepID=UPI001C9117CF|nr:hypothetical protein [Rhizobium laguerreae]MBY3157187.1 hypothetical protein [Rhizobium laguerreae]
MTSEENFAKALADGFLSSAVRKRLEISDRPSYVVGDGTAVVLDDHVRIPESVGGPRAGQWGVVIKLSADGLGIRFEDKVARITREFFEWNELSGARATAAPRDRKRKSVTPPTL